MILEEIIAIIASLIPTCASEPPQLISGHDGIENNNSEFQEGTSQIEINSTLDKDPREIETFWQNEIHREYEQAENRHFLPLVFDDEVRGRCSVRQSMLRSLRVNCAFIIAVVFSLALLAFALIYLELNTKVLCLQCENDNHSIPLSVKKWRLIGDEIEDVVLNLWLPVSMALLFGWIKFKTNYITTLFVGFAFGTTVANYKSILFIFYKLGNSVERIGDAMFFVNFIIFTIFVIRKFRKVNSSTTYSILRIFLVIIVQFFFCSVWSWLYTLSIVPYFNQQKDETHKAIVATFLVALTPSIPSAICQYIALWKSTGMIQPNRSFVQVYFLRGGAICLYRIMQADFKSISLFVGLSFIHGTLKTVVKITHRIRERLWTAVVERLKRTFCCRRLEQLPYNTPHQRRLNADLEIQNTLFEYTSLILSQAYLVLYLVTNYEATHSLWPVVKDSLIRLSIAISIEFCFNCMSFFIQIHWNDVPIQRVWFKCWKLHLAATGIIISIMVFFFTQIILTTYQTRLNDISEKYNIGNCSCRPPFTF